MNPNGKFNSGFEFLQKQSLFGNSKLSSNFFNDLIKLAEKNSQAIENISSVKNILKIRKSKKMTFCWTQCKRKEKP